MIQVVVHRGLLSHPSGFLLGLGIASGRRSHCHPYQLRGHRQHALMSLAREDLFTDEAYQCLVGASSQGCGTEIAAGSLADQPADNRMDRYLLGKAAADQRISDLVEDRAA